VVDADLIVCTHFLCARVLSAMRSRNLLRGKLAVVITDQHPHAVWRIPNADMYLVASHSAVDVLEAAGIERTRTLVSGIPIDGVFGQKLLPGEARARHGIEPNVPLALITGGGLGLGGLDRALEGYLSGTRAGHALVVCGSNAKLKAELEEMMSQHSARERVTILGMTSKMHELMAAADVMVGKPGGLTTSEALARGLPMVLLRPIPGQEECNATKLVEAGAAVLVQDSFDAGKRAAMLISEIGLLQEMKGAAVAMGRPNATEYAARAIVRMAMKPRVAEVASIEPVLVAG
jgi:processive 1,2-diacylglycerol beta-glucosyltransferase